MRIEKVTLYNYRLYKGENKVTFPKDDTRNIFVIYGENGYGKTTFLQSLMWCLYGRMIIDVDEDIRSDINAKGYENYLKESLNVEIKNSTASDKVYFVEMQISELRIPTMPSATLQIKRSFDYVKNKETFTLLIDGHENELARQIGFDVFINDFVLSKDIARLFFFDSERIVRLAEGQSKEERLRLGSAYNEVIGIKKYEDLRTNLENISLKIKKESLDEDGEKKLNQLSTELVQTETKLDLLQREIEGFTAKKESYKQEQKDIQTQLLREGSVVDLEEKKKATAERNLSVLHNQDLKNHLKDYLDYAPFAIAGPLFKDAVSLVNHDFKVAESKKSFIRQRETIDDIQQKLDRLLQQVDLAAVQKETLQKQVQQILAEYHTEPINEEVLIDVSKETHEQVNSVESMLRTTYLTEFRAMIDDYRKNKQQIDKLNKLLRRAEEEDGNAKISSLKHKFSELQQKITDAERDILDLNVTVATTNLEKDKQQKLFDNYQASLKVREDNKDKAELTQTLIEEITTYLHSLRQLKDKSIESKIKDILNALMHKSDFVDSIRLNMTSGDFDVHLFASNSNEIPKSSLSKGEQQLYASALLMALVEESGIEFPVFIDSPLQKFDKKHAERIITDFYPKVSSQVVLLPIADKELTEEEERLLEPKVMSRYEIVNDGMSSKIKTTCSNK